MQTVGFKMSKNNIRAAMVMSCIGATILIGFSGNHGAFYSATLLTLALAFIAEKKGEK